MSAATQSTNGAGPSSALDTSGSIPPPSTEAPRRTAPASVQPTPAPDRAADGAEPGPHAGGEQPARPPLEVDRLDPAQAEALAKVAAMAADRHGEHGPSRMLAGTVITLGVLLVAILILALALSL